MDLLREHGLVGGNNIIKGEEIRMYVQLTQPIDNINIGDIWIKDDFTKNNVRYYSVEPTNPQVNDIWVNIGDLIYKFNISQGAELTNTKTTEIMMRITTESLGQLNPEHCKIMKTSTQELFALLGATRRWDGVKWTFLESYCWNGTLWNNISNKDYRLYIVDEKPNLYKLTPDNVKTEIPIITKAYYMASDNIGNVYMVGGDRFVYKYNKLTGDIVASTYNLGSQATSIAVNSYGVFVYANTKITKYNHNLELIKEIIGLPSSVKLYLSIDKLFVHSGTTTKLYDINLNLITSAVTYSDSIKSSGFVDKNGNFVVINSYESQNAIIKVYSGNDLSLISTHNTDLPKTGTFTISYLITSNINYIYCYFGMKTYVLDIDDYSLIKTFTVNNMSTDNKYHILMPDNTYYTAHSNLRTVNKYDENGDIVWTNVVQSVSNLYLSGICNGVGLIGAYPQNY